MKNIRKYLLCEDAVSPVVGVMLMLVVTIIIAAVVSGFAGGLMSSTEKPPTIAMDVSIANNGYWTGSHFSAEVTSLDEMVSTADLQLTTQWTKTVNGEVVHGGATINPGEENYHVESKPYGAGVQYAWWNITCPQGFGPGVEAFKGEKNEWAYAPVMCADVDYAAHETFGPTDYDHIVNTSWFGNYNLVLGTTMWAEPFGGATAPDSGGYSGRGLTVGYGVNVSERWNYVYGTQSGKASFVEFTDPDDLSTGSVDQMMAVLGPDWYLLRAGDTVNVKLVHIPSGKVIFSKDVAVTEG